MTNLNINIDIRLDVAALVRNCAACALMLLAMTAGG
jgi:hypothetical protein